MKVSASITDFPLHTSIETFFRELKNCGADGVELVLGAKSVWSFEKIKMLSKKYDLPITSLHQSPWSGLGFFFEREFIKAIAVLEVKNIVFHPLAFASFNSTSMEKYFKKLDRLQSEFGIKVMLENMQNVSVYRKLYNSAPDESKHIEAVYDIAQKYNFLITFDTTHANFISPQEEIIFQKIYPKIGNIHLSSFGPKMEHLPLDEGVFDAKGFIKYLMQQNYGGLLTLEINYFLLERFVRPYDFMAIKKSIEIIRAVADK